MGMFAGSVAPTSKKLIRYAKDNLERPENGVYGCGFRTDVAQAALLNGFFGLASEMEDDQFPGGGRSLKNERRNNNGSFCNQRG